MNGRTPNFQIRFRAGAFEARDGICSFGCWLRALDVDEDHAGSVEIALAEAVNNVVEHAYSEIGPGDISIKAQLKGRNLIIDIRDSGNGLPGSRLPPRRAASVTGPRETLPEGGFGWFLIHQLTTALSYRRRAGRNRLTMQFDLDAPSP